MAETSSFVIAAKAEIRVGFARRAGPGFANAEVAGSPLLRRRRMESWIRPWRDDEARAMRAGTPRAS
jgi:hypothetical protein